MLLVGNRFLKWGEGVNFSLGQAEGWAMGAACLWLLEGVDVDWVLGLSGVGDSLVPEDSLLPVVGTFSLSRQ